MKSATFALALVGLVSAVPNHGNHDHAHLHYMKKRALVTETEWVTEVEYVTEIVDATTTQWITPTKEADPEPEPTTTSVPPPPPSPSPEEEKEEPTPEPVAQDDGHQFKDEPEQPQPEQPQEQPQEEPSTQPPAPPKPSVKPSVKPSPPAPKPEPTQPAQPSNPPADDEEDSQGGGSSGGKVHTGEITYYDLGLGACGIDSSGEDDSSNVVALSHLLMGTQSNGNPMCGQTITITNTNTGKSAKAVVKDKCMGCEPEDIDVSKKVYKELFGGSLQSGRMPAKWSFDSFAA